MTFSTFITNICFIVKSISPHNLNDLFPAYLLTLYLMVNYSTSFFILLSLMFLQLTSLSSLSSYQSHFVSLSLSRPRYPSPPLDLYSSLIFFNKILFFISCVFTTLLSLFFSVLHTIHLVFFDIIDRVCRKLNENDYIWVTIQCYNLW